MYQSSQDEVNQKTQAANYRPEYSTSSVGSSLNGPAQAPKPPTAIQCVASELEKSNQTLFMIINRMFQFKERMLGSTPQPEDGSGKQSGRMGGFGQIADQLETLGLSIQRLNSIANEIEKIG